MHPYYESGELSFICVIVLPCLFVKTHHICSQEQGNAFQRSIIALCFVGIYQCTDIYKKNIVQKMAHFELLEGRGHAKRRRFLPIEDLTILDGLPRSRSGYYSCFKQMERMGVCPSSLSWTVVERV